jgi:hypothetical protein
LSGKWYTVSTAILLVLVMLIIITTTSISRLLLNNKLVYAATISPSVRVNGKTLYATAASSALPHSKAFPSLTRSLSSIITKIKEGNNNKNNLTKGRSFPSFLFDTNRHGSSKGNSMTASAFENAVHNTVRINGKKINIAFIKPSFTAAAYDNSFYVFYKLYQDIPPRKNVTTDLNLLTSKVSTQTTDSSSSAFAMLYLSKNIKSLIPESKISVLTDADVDAGNIFATKNKSNRYDILVIGHKEYVTQQEYDNLRQFVSNGGTMIILDGNIFYAEVKYDML